MVLAREAPAGLSGNTVPRPKERVPSGLEPPTWHKFVSTFLEKKTSSRVSETVYCFLWLRTSSKQKPLRGISWLELSHVVLSVTGVLELRVVEKLVVHLSTLG